MKKLTAKLSELVGEDAANAFASSYNNPAQERARRKCEQERIFDLLEEEERLEQAIIDADESLERKEQGNAKEDGQGAAEHLGRRQVNETYGAPKARCRRINQFEEEHTYEGGGRGARNTWISASRPSIAEEDSDDESVQSGVSETGMHHQDDSFRSSEVEDSEDDDDAHGAPLLEDEEYDIDTAQHNREIALAYYAKRETVGAVAREALEQLEGDEPRDPELVKDSKPSVSRFGAARMASAYGASVPLQSLPTVIPESSIKTVQSAIRLGKIDDDGRLISATGESSDEETNAVVSEVLDLIKTGKAVNVGPQESTVHSTVVPPWRRSKQDDKSSTDESVNDKVKSAFNRLEISEAKPPRPPKGATPTRVAQPSTKVAPVYNPLIVDSPSYPPQVSSRPQRPPMVMSSKVLETEKRAAPRHNQPKAHPRKSRDSCGKGQSSLTSIRSSCIGLVPMIHCRYNDIARRK
ncbi:Glycosyltransferase Family protein [Salix suchowensis]|nr:Glycosyltransferase Family protein [Salix suchowensis]